MTQESGSVVWDGGGEEGGGGEGGIWHLLEITAGVGVPA